MNWWKRHVGTDFVETAIWGAVAFFGTISIAEATNADELAIGVGVVILVLFGLRRHFLMQGRPPEISGEVSGGWRTADLEARMAELEHLHQRVAELEERVDFSERLLASQADARKLEAPR
jgi:hypothetical protein